MKLFKFGRKRVVESEKQSVTKVTEVSKKIEWDWNNWTSTEGFPVSAELMDWIIGQDHAIKETKLCIDEWVNKLKYLKKREWWKVFENPMGYKPQPKEMLPAGPFLLLLGDAGTGKSLLGRAMSAYMTRIYKENDLKLCDVVGWKNPVLPSEPKISIHPSDESKEIISKENKKAMKKSRWSKWGMKIIQGFLLGMGGTILALSFYWLFVPWITNAQWGYSVDEITMRMIPETVQQHYGGNFLEYLMSSLLPLAPLLGIGATMLFSGVFLTWIGRFLGGNNLQGIGGASNSNGPKLLVDNSSGMTPFIDATGHGSAQLFGSIAWDPYQTGGLGTPEHQRISAGDVHRAHLGILFIDEIKNLTGMEAITLLTVLEDGQLPIALRSQMHGGDTAAMAVSTEPVPCMVFLIAAGNLDSLCNVHPALLDRIQGYGKVVYMNNDMPNTEENRRKVIQFMAQEIKRFNLLPFSREACEEVIAEFRRKSGRNDKLTTKFRPMISVIKTASVLASNEGLNIVEKKHVREAIEQHCISIGTQILYREATRKNEYLVYNVNDKPKVGIIFGLSVSAISNDIMVGSVMPIKASMEKARKDKDGNLHGYFHITGVETEGSSWIQNSILKVRHVFLQKCGKDPIEFKTHIDFAQEMGVDGPSAGVAMTLSLISTFTKKKIRQDTAITGEINIGVDGIIEVTPIGGVHEKILAAQHIGMKRVLIPKRNYELDIELKDYTIEVIPCETLDDYMREILVE
jgi:Lon-like ATP-dependent protease